MGDSAYIDFYLWGEAPFLKGNILDERSVASQEGSTLDSFLDTHDHSIIWTVIKRWEVRSILD